MRFSSRKKLKPNRVKLMVYYRGRKKQQREINQNRETDDYYWGRFKYNSQFKLHHPSGSN